MRIYWLEFGSIHPIEVQRILHVKSLTFNVLEYLTISLQHILCHLDILEPISVCAGVGIAAIREYSLTRAVHSWSFMRRELKLK
jgi:hypothetical protein